MASPSDMRFGVRVAHWESERDVLGSIRRQVFIEEQGVPEALEWDGLDEAATHLIAESSPDRQPPERQPIGTARVLSSGQIGRMAVLPSWRRRGVGRALLMHALRLAREQGLPTAWMNAQISALPFYTELGFAPEGEPFDEAGIPHQRLRLADPNAGSAADIIGRRLGVSSGLLRTNQRALLRAATETLSSQARRELSILTSDLEPDLYDQAEVVGAVRQLGIASRRQLPVRILLLDAEPAVRRGHRLIELSRVLSSTVQIRAVEEELQAQCDRFLLADDHGYCLRHRADPDTALIDFNAAAEVRRLRRQFEQLWQRSTEHPGLRRLHL